MRERLKSLQLSVILAAVLYIALGLVLLLWPDLSSTVLCYAFGAVLLLYGVFTLFTLFRSGGTSVAFRLEQVVAAVAAALGLVFLLWPHMILSFLPVVFGVYLVVDSIPAIKRAWEMRRYHYERWAVALALALLGAGLGLFIVFQPWFTAKVLLRIIGAVFVYQGVADLWGIRTITVLVKNAPIEADPIDVE